jgi:hypothetical protein
MGSAVPCSEAQLHSAERVYMEYTPGLREAGQRSAMCTAAFAASCKEKPRPSIHLLG